jgi:hypothetical protein
VASGSPVPLSRSSLRPVLVGASDVRCLAQTWRFGVARAPQPKLTPAGAFRCEWRAVLGSNAALRGRPCPVAGRSLRPSWPPFARSLLRCAIHGCARILRRLSEHGRPLAFSAGRGASRRRYVSVALCLCGAMSLCRAIDRPPGWRRFDERAEPAQAKTVRMLRVEPISLPTGRPDGGASMSGRSPPKRKRAGCSCFA